MKLKQGLHADVPMVDYVGDRLGLPEPSLSTSILCELAMRSPAHAWTIHPRLNPQHEQESSARQDLGSATHDVMFGGYKKNKVVLISAEDWKTKDARKHRDLARSRGKIPVLAKHAEAIYAMVESCRDTLAAAKIDYALRNAEHTVIWRDGGNWCRCRPDLFTPKYVIDLKTTENAAPGAFTRTIVPNGYHIQGRWMTRGLYEIDKTNRDCIFLAAEIEPPYASSLVGLDPAFSELAEREINRALKIWRKCLDKKTWPRYPPVIHWVSPPTWLEYDVDARHGGEQ